MRGGGERDISIDRILYIEHPFPRFHGFGFGFGVSFLPFSSSSSSSLTI